MKKLLILFSLLIFLTVGGVKAAQVYGDLEFDVYDNKSYDLLTGAYVDDINYSVTNRIIIPMNSEDHTIYFNNTNFHHILFYDAFNKYLGYANTDKTDLQLSTHIGYDFAAGDWILAPEKATKFALVVYNYNDTRVLTAKTYDSIDVEAWEGLTYRDIFEGNNLFLTSGFTNDANAANFVYFDNTFSWEKNDLFLNYFYTRNSNYNLPLSNYYINMNFKTDITNSGFNFVFLIKGSEPDISNTYYDIPTSFVDNSFVFYNSIDDMRYWPQFSTNNEQRVFTIDFDNTHLYDLNSIFTGVSMPTITEFETMLDYFTLNFETSGYVMNYNEIFGTPTQFGGSNNLVLIGDNEFTLYRNSFRTNTELLSKNTVVDSIYYASFKIKNSNIPFGLSYKPGNQVVITGFEDGFYSTIYTVLYAFNTEYVFLSSSHPDTDDYLGTYYNRLIYDLTDIFQQSHEPDIETFEGYYDVWTDPYDGHYISYLFAINLTSLNIQYLYDDTPAAPLDTQNSIDDTLLGLGADSPEMQVFLALGIMVLVAIFIGYKTRSTMFIVMAETLLIVIFAMLGWFSFWILLLIALISVLLLFKTILKRE